MGPWRQATVTTLTRKEVADLQIRTLPICARCGKQVEHGEVRQSMTMNRYVIRVHCHGETEEVWLDMKELAGMTGNVVLRPAFAKELPNERPGTEEALR